MKRMGDSVNMEIQVKTIEKDLEYLRQVSKPVDFQDDSYKEMILPKNTRARSIRDSFTSCLFKEDRFKSFR